MEKDFISKNKAYFFIAIAIIGSGLSSTFVELGLNSIPSVPFLFYRFAISTIILTPIILIKKRDQVALLFKNKLVWLIGIFEGIGLILQYIGQELQIPAGLATLLTITYALMVPFFSWILLKQEIKLYHLIAVIMSLIGIFLIISEGSLTFLSTSSFSLIGIIILISSAIFLGLYITFTSYIQKLHNNNLDSFSLFYVTLVIISLFSIFTMVLKNEYVIPSRDTWIWILLLVFFSTIIAFYMYFKSMKTLSANQVSLLLLLQVIVPFAIDIFLFGRNYNLWVLIGSLVLFISVFLSTLISSKSNRNNP
ncbi:MAG: DMT family transporter [Candidatus Thorarchaeota archaeon]